MFYIQFSGNVALSARYSIRLPVFLSFHTLRSSADRLFLRSKFNEIPSLNGTSEYLLFRISCKQRGFLNTFSLPPFGVFLSPHFRKKRSARFCVSLLSLLEDSFLPKVFCFPRSRPTFNLFRWSCGGINFSCASVSTSLHIWKERTFLVCFFLFTLLLYHENFVCQYFFQKKLQENFRWNWFVFTIILLLYDRYCFLYRRSPPIVFLPPRRAVYLVGSNFASAENSNRSSTLSL